MRHWMLLSVLLIGIVVFASAQTNETDESTRALKSGESVNRALATVTSTAISPLLGVSVMGVWTYYKTPKQQRGLLPFFDHPYFWAPTMVLLALIFIKDTFGGFAPLIKKPLDAIEVLLVNHVSLILIVFPVMMNQVTRVMGLPSLKSLFAYLLSGPMAYAATTTQATGIHHAFSVATAILYVMVGFAITGVVWLLGHSFDVLALLSPFPFVDFLLKAIRNVIFAVLLGTSIISPTMGLVLSLVVIIVSFLAFGWALRLSFFGTLYGLSLLELLLLDMKAKPREDGVRAFSAGVKGISKRTYGTLASSQNGSLTFAYRRMLLGPEKTVVLGRANSFSVARGVFHPTVVEPIESANKHRIVFRLLPTYRGAEEEIREVLQSASVEDLRWTKGLASFWKFVTEGDEGAAEKA